MKQNAHRPGVEDDVMDSEKKNMLILTLAQQADSEQWSAR